MARDRKARDIDQLKETLEAERRKEEEAKEAADNRRRRRTASSGRKAQYQGRAIPGQQASSRSPESGRSGRQRRSSNASRDESKQIKDLLRKVTTLYQDGLITKAEYDAKRAEILDRL